MTSKILGRVGDLCRADVHDPVVVLDVRIFRCDLVEDTMKQPVGLSS